MAKYWKNGVEVVLSDGTVDAGASSIAVVDGNIYIAGNEINKSTGNTMAVYWKNGARTVLDNGGTGSFGAVATTISVIGKDVYVAGRIEKNNKRIATYWKNGTAIMLSDESKDSEANSIVVQGGVSIS